MGSSLLLTLSPQIPQTRLPLQGPPGREKNIMSRSRRKTPMRGITTAESEKKNKQLANRKERHRNRQLLGYFLDETLLMHRRQAGNPWLMDKDGKAFFDPEKYPELMRK